jgi:hypothetical protein
VKNILALTTDKRETADRIVPIAKALESVKV